MNTMRRIQSIIDNESYNRDTITFLLERTDAEEIECIRKRAEDILLKYCTNKVYYRGLVEFSNVCMLNCLYCGIRAGNTDVERYSLNKNQIIEAALWCAENEYGSIVLQSGERRDKEFLDFVEDITAAIKQRSRSSTLPNGLGITLCVGEQTRETYQRFFDAGAHRYLLRIETTNADLFSRIHPGSQTLQSRMSCLETLKDIGFQTGTGVMIGIPGQTIGMLADDLLFFRDRDFDMFGMGPYIVHDNAPMAHWHHAAPWPNDMLVTRSLLMLALTRLIMKDVNIAATTALQAVDPVGREKGLSFGANVIMPQLTPTQYRKNYLLYEGKPCVNEEKGDCKHCLSARIKSADREIGYNAWGDSRHYSARQKRNST